MRALDICVLAAGAAYPHSPEGPQPTVVDPGGPGRAPSDAVVWFNGRDNTGCTTPDGKPSKCTVACGVMILRTGAADTQSAESFRDVQIQLEFNIPDMPDAKGWAGGNSGVILLNWYEFQILYSCKSDMGGSEACAGITSFGPLVNACRPPGEWQSYDFGFHVPHCAPDGSAQPPGSLTVLQNGVLVPDHVPARSRRDCSRGPIGSPEPQPLRRPENRLGPGHRRSRPGYDSEIP